jgi:TPR repeat protein
MYFHGDGVEKDPALAVEWFRKAADQGHALAQAKLGIAYLLGEGVAPDPVEAWMWLDLSRSSGNEEAQKIFASLDAKIDAAQRSAAAERAQRWRAEHAQAPGDGAAP